MKKLLLTLSAIALVVGFSSCASTQSCDSKKACCPSKSSSCCPEVTCSK